MPFSSTIEERMLLSLGGFVLAIVCGFIDIASNCLSLPADRFLLEPV